jgi:hypothetical protein
VGRNFGGGRHVASFPCSSSRSCPLSVWTGWHFPPDFWTPQSWVSPHPHHWRQLFLAQYFPWSWYLPVSPALAKSGENSQLGADVWVSGWQVLSCLGDAPFAGKCSVVCSSRFSSPGSSRWCTSRPRSHMSCWWFSSSEELPCQELELESGTSSHQSGRNSRMPRWAYCFMYSRPWEGAFSMGHAQWYCLTEGLRESLRFYKILMILVHDAPRK